MFAVSGTGADAAGADTAEGPGATPIEALAKLVAAGGGKRAVEVGVLLTSSSSSSKLSFALANPWLWKSECEQG